MTNKYIKWIVLIVLLLVFPTVAQAVDQGARAMIRAHIYGDESATGQWGAANIILEFDDTDFIVTSTFDATDSKWIIDLEIGAGGSVTSVVPGYGIDTAGTTAITVSVDPTEIGTITWGAGTGFTWTFDGSAGTDTTIAFGDDTITTPNILAFADWDITGTTPTAGYLPYVAARDGDTATMGWKDPATLAANQNIWYTLLANSTATTTPSSPTATIDILGTANEITVVLTPGGSVATATYTFGLDDAIIIASETIQSTTANSGGGYKRMYSDVASAALSGATGTIQVNVPTGSRLLGCQLRVDTLVAGPFAWNAAYVTGATQAIGAGINVTKNTKVSTMFDCFAATPIASAEVDVLVTAVGGDFTAGVIRAIVYYETFITMDDNP